MSAPASGRRRVAHSLTCLVVVPATTAARGAGDEVVYRHAVDFLSRSMAIVTFELGSVGRARRAANLLRDTPPELARYICVRNAERLGEALRAHRPDIVLFLHEGGFFFVDQAKALGVPAVLFAHNVHSVVAGSDPSWIGRLFRGSALAFERRWCADPDIAMVCISRGDADGLREAGVYRTDIVVAPPGAPPATPLGQSAPVLAEMVLSGSLGWWRKRRDLTALAAARPSIDPITVFDSQAAAILGDQGRLADAASFDWSAGLRIGLIADRFRGGFKLKSLEYVARNCVVLSRCDLSSEFDGLPHAGEFVRFVASKRELVEAAREIWRTPAAALLERFAEFKAACLARYDWERSLELLRQTLIAKARNAP